MYIVVTPSGNVIGGYAKLADAKRSCNADAPGSKVWQIDLTGTIVVYDNLSDEEIEREQNLSRPDRFDSSF